jgi:hypothetical protein
LELFSLPIDASRKSTQELFQVVLEYSLASLAEKKERKFVAKGRFAKLVNETSSKGALEALVVMADRNRVTLVLSKLLSEEEGFVLSSPASDSKLTTIKNALDLVLARDHDLESKRDSVVKRLSLLLNGSSIEHFFFKTFNPFGGVGVDVDLMIRRKDFQRFVKLIMTSNFTAIDSISKTYATGFLLEGEEKNPTIVDLHTDLAILGVSYLSPEILFENVVEKNFFAESKEAKLNVPNDETEALVAMAHAVIKEGSIRASDLLVVYKGLCFHENSFSKAVRAQNLVTANELFMFIMNRALGLTSNGTSSNPNGSSLSSKLAMSFLLKSIPETRLGLPFKLPSESSALAFFDCVRSNGELGQALPKAISSFKYRRNIARAGQKLMAPFLN